ncbi:MAG TPA: hypothetical protein VF815_02585 [Myxococcaceae bacterium]|jgi:hypothetical protein
MAMLLGRISDAVRALPLANPASPPAQSSSPGALEPAQARAQLPLNTDAFGPVASLLPRSADIAQRLKFPLDGLPGRRPLPDIFDIPFPPQPSRTTSKALEEMDTLLAGAPTSYSSEGGAEVIRDGVSADAAEDQMPEQERYQTAKTQVEANAPLEQRKLESMTPAQRDAYQQVKQELMTIQPAGDPVAALALQKLLLTGKLTEGTSLRDGMTVLDGLSRLASSPVMEGFDRQQLLANLTQEIATPSTINQGGKGTCTVTCVAIMLARQNPAEYVRLIAGLASPAGEVTTASGKVLRPERDALYVDVGRTDVQQLLAPALMELAHPRLDYRNEEDAQYRRNKEIHGGLNSREVDRVLEGIFDDRYKRRDVGGFLEMGNKKAMRKIQEELGDGKEVLAGLKWGDSAHKVLVTGIENVNGQEYVHYINPWGREERIPKDEFRDRLIDFNHEK